MCYTIDSIVSSYFCWFLGGSYHMLKQSTSRNQRAKGFKVKHAIQISVLLLVFVWVLYQLKQFYMNTNPEIQVAFLGTTEGVSLLGRKGLIDSQVKEGNVDEEQAVEKVEEEEPELLEDLIDEDDKDERIGKVIGQQVLRIHGEW
ncbi:hypothetical protein LXL04_030264 [Taraxacum kok-saghyz]